MRYLRRLFKWLLRAWPVLTLLPVAAIHMLALQSFPSHVVLVNKLTGTILQIGGGVIVLLSLDGNLGLFRKQGLFKTFRSWIEDFPGLREQVSSLGGVSMVGNMTATGKLSVGRAAPITLEERVVALERRIEEEALRLSSLETSTSERLASLKSELTQTVSDVQSSLRELNLKVEQTAIGGLKQQLLGVFLAIYGALLSVFA
jgi:hypothetical protein